MAFNLSDLTGVGGAISGLLGKVQGELPAVVDAVKGLAEQGQKLFDTVKAHIGDLGKGFGGTMSEAETLAAVEAGKARLKADMDAVDAGPKTGQA